MRVVPPGDVSCMGMEPQHGKENKRQVRRTQVHQSSVHVRCRGHVEARACEGDAASRRDTWQAEARRRRRCPCSTVHSWSCTISIRWLQRTP